MYLTVCLLWGSGVIAQPWRSISRDFSDWLNTLCQPVLSQRAENASVSSQWHHTTRGHRERPQVNDGRTISKHYPFTSVSRFMTASWDGSTDSEFNF